MPLKIEDLELLSNYVELRAATQNPEILPRAYNDLPNLDILFQSNLCPLPQRLLSLG